MRLYSQAELVGTGGFLDRELRLAKLSRCPFPEVIPEHDQTSIQENV